MATAQAISSALFYRERYKKGQHIKIAMLDVMIAYLWPEGSSTLSFVGKEKNPSDGQLGLDLVFITKDKKYITAGAVTDIEWVGLCKAIKREDLIDNIKFNTPNARVKNKVERRKIIAEEIAKQSCEDLLSSLQDQEVPSAPILSREEVIENEQVLENNMIQYFDS